MAAVTKALRLQKPPPPQVTGGDDESNKKVVIVSTPSDSSEDKLLVEVKVEQQEEEEEPGRVAEVATKRKRNPKRPRGDTEQDNVEEPDAEADFVDGVNQHW